MNKTKNLIWFLAIIALCTLAFVFYNTYTKQKMNAQPTPVFSDEFTTNDSKEFSDGLTNPDSVTQYPLDELETGISEKSIYYIDINQDNKPDRITKTFFETGTAHSYYEYKIELNQNGKFVDITPKDFRTVNGADCDLQQIQFVFKPKFKVILISRELGETWLDATVAQKQVFQLSENKLKKTETKTLRKICDVRELF
ncbi:MAG: hypothetical protein IK122_01735 [Alphaproteobacteria bacterium]|nr:hypothetical protein [Alphaproteobacteria bacterium]